MVPCLACHPVLVASRWPNFMVVDIATDKRNIRPQGLIVDWTGKCPVVGLATADGRRSFFNAAGTLWLTKREGWVGASSVHCARTLLIFLFIMHRWVLLNLSPTRS